MGFVDRLQQLTSPRRDYPLGLTVSSTDRVFGRDKERFSPSEYGSYYQTSNGVYACVRLRATLMSSLPLLLWKGQAEQRRRVDTGVLRDLLDRVNPFWTFNRLIEMTETSLGLWGEAFWILERGVNGRSEPREIWWAKPTQIRVVPHPTDYIAGYLLDVDGQTLPFTPGEVIWFRYPNPNDEFAGASPLAAARAAADVASSAMQANRQLFRQGMNLGGAIMPAEGGSLSSEQADELEERLRRRFTGADKAHRWAVFQHAYKLETFKVSNRDAQFVELLGWSLNDIARAYGVPPELVGDQQRTYDNFAQAERGIWTHTLRPEARFIATELTEQLLPMFGDQADAAEFDLSDVDALKHGEELVWSRVLEGFKAGLLGEKQAHELLGVPYDPDDRRLLSAGQGLVELAGNPAPPAPAANAPEEDTDRTAAGRQGTRQIEFGSDQHRELDRQRQQQLDPLEDEFASFVAGLFERQRRQIISDLNKQRMLRAVRPEDVFDFDLWVEAFRKLAKPVLRRILRSSGDQAVNGLPGVVSAFNISDPNVTRFLTERAQRFAEHVNDTTWTLLKTSLSEGVEAGESIPELARRVEEVMGDRIRSSSETIARTEVVAASNGGTLLGWQQSGVVSRKAWLAALDERTRSSHVQAHNRYQRNPIPLDEDFTVGGGTGPAPGQIGVASEDINCRCTIIPVVAERGVTPHPSSRNGNGERKVKRVVRDEHGRLAAVVEEPYADPTH